ncbi:hypothetical protein SCLCIDRAFT_1210431 [Scleroderma citrinum Foug A]|uniref:Uncharacterized protein n=1 Tax=Scleroderma citrinum Foug A TaxID=1036808 RepID=A0A0C3APS9_9AGAM|nr:hypothetical protein SCLCIDRAFT_1210431 [Scleroderma citrinum Foug A]
MNVSNVVFGSTNVLHCADPSGLLYRIILSDQHRNQTFAKLTKHKSKPPKMS